MNGGDPRPACALAHCRELTPLALALGLLIGTTNSSPVSGRSHRTDVALGGCDGIRGCPAPSSAHLARPAGLALRVARPVATARSGIGGPVRPGSLGDTTGRRAPE